MTFKQKLQAASPMLKKLNANITEFGGLRPEQELAYYIEQTRVKALMKKSSGIQSFDDFGDLIED
jgi:hypothetical protein